jgi:hypothetical protein
MLQYVANAYHWRRRHTHSCYNMSPAPTTGVTDILTTHAMHWSISPPPPAGSAPLTMPSWAHNRPTRPSTTADNKETPLTVHLCRQCLLAPPLGRPLAAIKPHRRRPLASPQGCPLATYLPRIWRPLAPPQGCPLATYKPRL